MKILTNKREETVRTVELFNDSTYWILRVDEEKFYLGRTCILLKEVKTLKDLKDFIRDLVAYQLFLSLDMTKNEAEQLRAYLLREWSSYLGFEKIRFIDSNSYERGFKDGQQDGYDEMSENLIDSIRELIEQDNKDEKELNLLIKIGAKALECSEDEFNTML